MKGTIFLLLVELSSSLILRDNANATNPVMLHEKQQNDANATNHVMLHQKQVPNAGRWYSVDAANSAMNKYFPGSVAAAGVAPPEGPAAGAMNEAAGNTGFGQVMQNTKLLDGCGGWRTKKGTCAKTYLADNPAVCYEQRAQADPISLEKMLAVNKASDVWGLYITSFITYGMDCEMRGYTFDKKPHPCFPLTAYTVFWSLKAQQEYREYRQKKSGLAVEKRNVTEGMLSGKCDGFERMRLGRADLDPNQAIPMPP